MPNSLNFPESGKELPPSPPLVVKKMCKLLNDDGSPATVTLISADSVQMQAMRKLLSTSGSYFDKLLFSKFAETYNSPISVSVHSFLLTNILDFIHTARCFVLRIIRHRCKYRCTVTCEDVRNLVDLATAADYTCVQGLLGRCERMLKSLVRSDPHLACVTVWAMGRGRVSWGQEAFREAIKITVKEPEESLLLDYKGCRLTCGLMHLDAQGAEAVFSSLKTDKPEQDKLFQALVVWATNTEALMKQWKRPSWAECKIMIDTENISIMEDRRETAMRIAQWFDLGSLKPSYLSNVVERSGLVDQNTLYLAYEEQAKQLEELSKSNESTISSLRSELKNSKPKL